MGVGNRRRAPSSGPPDRYRTYFDFDGAESLVTAIVYAVCALTGDDPRTAPLLSEVIDPVALDRLFGNATTRPRGTFEIEFTYNGCDVTVDSRGRIDVVARSDDQFQKRR